MELFNQKKSALGAGFGLEGPNSVIERKENLIDSIAREKVLKKSIKKYDPALAATMDMINTDLNLSVVSKFRSLKT